MNLPGFQSSRPFLTARWRHLVVMNFQVKSALLLPYVPAGTELDRFAGKTFVSLVGFLFQDTHLWDFLPAWPIQNFEEINLRFYVKRKVGKETRRGVCFIREVVPYFPIAWGARVLYNEPYVTHPTLYEHLWNDPQNLNKGGKFSYAWKVGNRWLGLSARTIGRLRTLEKNSAEEFILQHFWGYTKQRDGSTVEYPVHHPAWRFWKAKKSFLNRDVGEFYGKEFESVLRGLPHSVFVAEGSEIAVFAGRKTYSLIVDRGKDVRGWVLYDGTCGFCSWWLRFWSNVLKKRGFSSAPLQAEWVKERVHFSEEEVLKDIRILFSDNSIVSGADAYLFMMKKIWWAYPMGIFFSLPGIRWLFEKAYQSFNRNRFIVSRVCRLKPLMTESRDNQKIG